MKSVREGKERRGRRMPERTMGRKGIYWDKIFKRQGVRLKPKERGKQIRIIKERMLVERKGEQSVSRREKGT